MIITMVFNQLLSLCSSISLTYMLVEASDVQKAIDDAAADFGGVVAVSSLFDGTFLHIWGRPQ